MYNLDNMQDSPYHNAATWPEEKDPHLKMDSDWSDVECVKFDKEHCV